MDKRYNLYNLEPEFKKYLIAGNISPSSLKNYLSDFRHFAGWMEFYKIDGIINFQAISEYRSYLIENNLPRKTINRRLSTLRKFCSFCISQDWIKENPAKKITNVIASSSPAKRDPPHNDILKQFQSDLQKEKTSSQAINSYLEDISEFFTI